MKTHGIRFLVVPLLVMSLLALPCATYADTPSGLQRGVPYEPKPGELPNRPPLRPPPLRPGFHPGDCSALGGVLAQDTVCKYNPAATAIFKANTTITIGADGYVKQGTLALDQDVFYANGKSVKLKAGTSADFTVGLSPAYVYAGTLAGDQVLDWAPNRSATWKDSKPIRFYPGQGWVVLGTLVYGTSLLHDGSACCSSGSACAITFPKGMEVTCHVTGCDYPIPLGSCGACGTVGVSPSGACCCK